jgi:hypothetical protein
VPESIRIASRFNGPRGSGNGGYTAGLVAGLLGGEAEVNLRRPVPLDTELQVARDGADAVRVLDGEALVAEGRATAIDIEVPAPLSPSEARQAAERFPGPPDDIFSRCFVCGTEREDSFGVFAGAVEGRPLVATPWTPPAWTADSSELVRAEHVWAALDCPTYFAAYMDEPAAVSFLVQFTARVAAEVPAGIEHVVVAWPIEVDGRKRRAGSAVLSADGETLAVASALLVEPRAG